MKRLNLKAAEVEAKLRECNGNMAAVARHFGCDRSNIWHFCNKRKELKKVSVDIREAMKDNAESVLYREVLAGNLGAICFFLKCQAKDRGYIEKAEIDVRLLDALLAGEIGRVIGGNEAGPAEALTLHANGHANGAALPLPRRPEPPHDGGGNGTGPVADGPPPLDL